MKEDSEKVPQSDNVPFEAFDPIVNVVDSKEAKHSHRTQLIAYANNEAQRNLRIGMEAQVWPANEKRSPLSFVNLTNHTIPAYCHF